MLKTITVICLCLSLCFSSFSVSAQANDPFNTYVQKCQNLAGDYFDPRTPKKGVVFEQIDGVSAVNICEKAATEQPENALVLYWLLRAYLAEGFASDAKLEKLLNTYLKLRAMNEHFLAVYHMRVHEDAVMEAENRHTANLRQRFYWCEKGFCGFQIYDDAQVFVRDGRKNIYYYYAEQGYYPAELIYYKLFCNFKDLAKAEFSEPVVAKGYEKYKNGEAVYGFAFAFAFANSVELHSEGELQVEQNCIPRMKLADVETYILPLMKEYSQTLPYMLDFSPYIQAIEHDVNVNKPFNANIAAITSVREKIANQIALTPSEFELIKATATVGIAEDFHKKQQVIAQAKNLYGLMLFYGLETTQDRAAAMQMWFEVAEYNAYYSVPSVFNLLSNAKLLSAEQLEFLAFSFKTETMTKEERVTYVTYLISLDGFENVLSNDYNIRGRSALYFDISNEQFHGAGYAPANANPAEKLYEFLSAQSINENRIQTAAIIAGVVAGLAIVGSASGPYQPSKAKKLDPCVGLNGLGWIDNTLGNAAAFFGCRKY